MIDIRALKAEMVRNGYTQEHLAKELGITSRTFTNRLNTGDFSRSEIETMISLLHLSDPIQVFFKPN